MDRIILGKATTNTTSQHYHRSDRFGLFVSRPGANVQNCSDGDLIFDSTAAGIVQKMGRGAAIIPNQTFDVGLLGETGVINEKNWNSPSAVIPDLNRKTSWVFDAFAQLNSEMSTFAPPGEFAGALLFSLFLIGYDIHPYLPWIVYKNHIGDHGNISDEDYIKTTLKNYWRIVNVFPFLADIPAQYDFGSDLVGSHQQSTPGSFPPLFPDVTKMLSTARASELTESQQFSFFPNAWKTAWENYIDTNPGVKYPDTTAYGGEFMVRTEPKYWRALSTPGKPVIDEPAAMVRLYQMIFQFSWLYNNFGSTINNGDLNFTVTPAGATGFPIADPFDADSTVGVTKLYSALNPTNNWGYTQWKGGETTVSTGITPPSLNPVQVWWQPVIRDAGNTVTNLTFLDIRDNLSKTENEKELLIAQKPGLASIQANTYIEDNEIKINFTQPSTEDTSEVFFSIFRENAHKDAPEDVDAIIALNVTDTADGGDNLAGRKAADGRYYTVVFPDDFVGTKGTDTDPFVKYRGADGKVYKRLSVTLNIPEGVELSGNSFNNHIKLDQLSGSGIYQGGGQFGPLDSAGRPAYERYAMVDPCIKLNILQADWSKTALEGLTINIVNNGKLIGAGGWGQYGQFITSSKYAEKAPGGGGGGGQGYHPTLSTENQDDWLGTAPTAAMISDYSEGVSGAISGDDEIALLRAAIVGDWDGPENYVEWGIGRASDANTSYTGMSYITWKSIGPGKPGTGYLGSTSSAIVSQPRIVVPFYDEPLKLSNFGIVTSFSARVAGTYFPTGAKRFSELGWGNAGTPGTISSAGAGGADMSTLTFGWNQDPFINIDYDSYSGNPLIGNVDGIGDGNPQSGSGGSCVYLYSDFIEPVSGLRVLLTNEATGTIKSGGGGGSGGLGIGGLSGGKLGRPGECITSTLVDSPAGYHLNENSENAWTDYSRRGEPGKLVWWNSSSITSNYNILNNNTDLTDDGFAIEGGEYNPEISSWDYVSILSSITIYSRKLSGTEHVYTGMGEKTWTSYLTELASP